MENLNILIAGVGGQGTLLASRVLGSYALKCGLDCKLSEVHGMAQRGGSVVTHVKMGKKIFSPVISPGEADVLIAFEALESGRYAHFVNKDGIIIASTQKIMPMSVVTGGAAYPHAMLDNLALQGYNITKTDAVAIALNAGNLKALNIVMIGCLAKLKNLNVDIVKEAIKESVPEKTLAVNLKAFELGFNAV